jgi:hypothetical protein
MPVPVSLDLIEIALFRNSGGKRAVMVLWSRPVARLQTPAIKSFSFSNFRKPCDHPDVHVALGIRESLAASIFMAPLE